MKRITFALCAILISLSTMAQGTLQERLKGNPMIDSLVSKVAALGGSGQVSYYYDGKLHKTVNIFCSLMNDFEPTPPTGDPQRDARNQKMDSVRKEAASRGTGYLISFATPARHLPTMPRKATHGNTIAMEWTVYAIPLP